MIPIPTVGVGNGGGMVMSRFMGFTLTRGVILAQLHAPGTLGTSGTLGTVRRQPLPRESDPATAPTHCRPQRNRREADCLRPQG